MKKKQIVLVHIVFWTLYCIAYGTSAFGNFNNYLFLYNFFARRILDASLFYLCYFIVSAKLYSVKNILIYAFTFSIFICLYAFFYAYITSLIRFYIINPSSSFGDVYYNHYRTGVVNLFTASVLGTSLKFSILWYNTVIKQKELEKQNIKNELALLRAQINPHFFFNTLNNIKSFASINSDKTLHIINKFSDTMHYILYDSSVEKIELKKEIEFIKSFLELQKIRYDDPNYIKFIVRGDFYNMMIPPLLFIPFIENAFKHGNKLAPSPGIDINFRIEKNKIEFEISNYLRTDDGIKRLNGGFGLNNIKRRLELLFDKNYNLDITSNNNQFIVKLIILLK